MKKGHGSPPRTPETGSGPQSPLSMASPKSHGRPLSRVGRAKGRHRSDSSHDEAEVESLPQRREPSLAVDEAVPIDNSATMKAIEEAKEFREEFAGLQEAFKTSLEREAALIGMVRFLRGLSAYSREF